MVRFALKNSKKSALALIGVAALSLTMAAPAFAADGTSATVTGGDLTITNPTAANFVGKDITGVEQTTTAALDAFSVSDLRGSGEGWAVTAEATQFTGATHNLTAGSLELSQPTVTADGTDSPAPTVATGPYTIDGGDPVTIATADTDEGMGVYDFGATTLTLTLPADVYADTYQSTVTITFFVAP